MGPFFDGATIGRLARIDSGRTGKERHQAVEFVGWEGPGEPAGSAQGEDCPVPWIRGEEVLGEHPTAETA